MDWVAIDSQPSDLRAVPTKACFFNTSTNHFCCVNVWGPGTTHCSQACQSCLSQCWGILKCLKSRAVVFILNISNLQELPGFTEEPVVIDVLEPVCGQWVPYRKNWVFGVFWEPRLGALRTAVISRSSLLQVLIPAQELSTYT
jgi:hypothetical protein